MDRTLPGPVMPENVRQLTALVLTLSAALLYGLVLGSAVLRTIIGPPPDFGPNVVRMAGLLSGLVGSVVTAGFARSDPPVSVQMSASHAIGGQALSAWRSLRPLSLLKRNLLGLGQMLGVRVGPRLAQAPAEDDLVQETPRINLALWIGGFYLFIYMLVGLASVGVTLWIANTPEMVSQSGWVWLGTTVSSAYSFFNLNAQS
ncbi:MAG: hypothetical protein JXA74_00900 [Anaerolineae bacterium]|nr:hypothetical protein [Anaerolineae bacterium]